MKIIDPKDALKGYKERVSRLALFDVFSKIDRKHRKDNNGKDIDYFGLLLSTLLFFYECMLVRKKNSGIDELALYLKNVTRPFYLLSDSDYKKIASEIVSVLRLSDGTRNRRDFFNFETGKADYVEYNILKVSSWDKEKSRQYYMLDEDGLELIFASKEFFSEYRISISQLVLRKQLEKGEFAGALRQIEEMKIEVDSISQNMITVKHEIQQNIVSDEIYSRYKKIVEDISYRLQREHDEFEELLDFIKKTRIRLMNSTTNDEKSLTASIEIVKIDNELIKVHSMHSNLLHDSIELKTVALESARESMYYTGLASFNFKNEIVTKIVSTPLPIEINRLFVNPFLTMEKAKLWSPLTLFARQRTVSDEKENMPREFLEVAEEVDDEILLLRQDRYQFILFKILEVMDDNNSSTLSYIYENIDKKNIDIKDFCDFFIIAHQFSPIHIKTVVNNEKHIFSKAFENFNKEELIVNELEDTVFIDNNYLISDMNIEFK